MFENALAVEAIHASGAIAPQNITGAATSSPWVSMKYSRKIRFLIITGAWAGGTPAVTLTQAQDAAGTGSKALQMKKYWQVTSWSTPADSNVENAVTSDTFNLPASANNHFIIEVLCNDLDINNNFKYVKLNIASPGANNDFLAAIWEAYALRDECAPVTQPSLIV